MEKPHQPAPTPEVAPSPRLPFAELLGRPASEAELKETQTLDLKGRVAWFLARDELYAHWLEQELRHLGLIGAYRPRKKPSAQVKTAPLALFAELVRRPEWSARHVGGEAFAVALTEQVLGLDPHAAERVELLAAARSAYSGHPSTFLEKKAAGHEDLVRIALEDDHCLEAIVQRTCQRVRGRAPEGTELTALARRVRNDPASLFRILVEWACS